MRIVERVLQNRDRGVVYKEARRQGDNAEKGNREQCMKVVLLHSGLGYISIQRVNIGLGYMAPCTAASRRRHGAMVVVKLCGFTIVL